MHRQVHMNVVRHGPVPNYRMAVFRENWGHGRGIWVAMIVDKWLTTQGLTRTKAVRSLRGLVTASYRHAWLDGYKRAPDEYLGLWKGRHLWTGTGACLLADRPMLVARMCTSTDVPKAPPRRKRVSALVPGRDIPEGFAGPYTKAWRHA